MPPSLLSANLASRTICPEWPASLTRVPSPWPSPQGEGTGSWMLAICAPKSLRAYNQPLFPKPRAWRDGTVCPLLPLREKGWG